MLEKIKDILKENPETEISYVNCKGKTVSYNYDLISRLKEIYKEPVEIEGITIEAEEVFGGGEGDGEEYYIVFSARSGADEPKRYFKIPGWYQSYHGSELEIENTFEVVPGEKVVRVWNKA